MNCHIIAKVVCALLSIYFVVSGINVMFNTDAKLERIGLAATSSDGKIAFILIYCSLMVGIGMAMTAMALLLRSAGPSLMLAGAVLLCFTTVRFSAGSEARKRVLVGVLRRFWLVPI